MRGAWLGAAMLLAALAGADAFIGKGYCTDMSCTSGVNNIPEARWKGNQGKVKYLGAFETVQECESACLKYKNWKGKTCKSFAWHAPQEEGGCQGKKKCFETLCYGLTSDSWDPVPQANVISGKIGQGVAEAVNKAFSTVASTVTAPAISITDMFGGEEKKPGAQSDKKTAPKKPELKKDDKKKAEEAKRQQEKERREREEREKKAAEEARREKERRSAEEAKRVEEAKREESRRKEQQSKRSQEEQKRQEEARAAEEARKKKANEEAKRAAAARAKAQEQEAKKKKKSKTNGSGSGGRGFLGVEGLDVLLSASATRMSISAAIVAILATYFGAKHAERSIKHKKLEEDLRSKGHIDDEGAWRL